MDFPVDDFKEIFFFQFFNRPDHRFHPQSRYGGNLLPRQGNFKGILGLVAAETFLIAQSPFYPYFRAQGGIVLQHDIFMVQTLRQEFIDIP